MRGLGYMITWI